MILIFLLPRAFLDLDFGLDKVVDRCKFCREILKVSSK